VRFRKVTLVGVGLLGGSLGMALRQRGLAEHVCGVVRRSAIIADCERLGAVDMATRNLGPAVRGADLVVLCSPIGQMGPLTQELIPYLEPDAVVTDVGSVKGTLVDELEAPIAKAGGHFIGSHPMAGSEKTGVQAARADLFEGALCAVTPTARSNAAALARVQQLWAALGSRVLTLSPAQHDDLVSRSSHLPHVVAAALANYVLSPANPKEQAALCAGGFRDTTRIASGSPEMWRDIALANRENLARVLGVLIEDLQEFQHSLQQGDSKAVTEFFTSAKERRDAWANPSATATAE
jgi:prephenate dehydrogenase